jgi:putative ABC transport system permease protein
LKNDLRFALRTIRSHPWFSAAVVATLALGIGINTTVFTLVNAVLFKPIPLPEGTRLVTISNHRLANPGEGDRIAYLDFLEYRGSGGSFEDLEAVSVGQGVMSEAAIPPERYSLGRVSAGLFEMLRTPPRRGRGFTARDDQAGAEAVVLISHRIWQARYAGAGVVGRAVRVNGRSATIVGVMPEGFRFPVNQDLWMPLVPSEALRDRSNRGLMLFGRLRPKVSIASAQADLAVVGHRLAADFPQTNHDLVPVVRTFNDAFNGGPIRVVFLMMLGAVGLVLLIACANVANLMLSRAIARRGEMAVRTAIGASRWRIVRQVLVESVVLSCAGGVLGLGLTLAGTQAFARAVSDVEGKPYWITFGMDWTAFSYFALISVASGIAFGLVPALRASRVDLNTALKNDSRVAGSRRAKRLSASLVVCQFALTVVLLAGAGMMVRAFFVAEAMNPFLPAERIFAARLQLPEDKGERYEQPATRLQFHERLVEELSALPGVTAAATASSLPGLGAGRRPIEIEGRPNLDPKQAPQAEFVVQTPAYLPTIGLPILVGRGFEATDGDPGREAAVVTRAFAAKHWPGTPTVGRRFRFVQGEEPGPWMTVVGVSADIVQDPQDPDAPPLVFMTCRQEAWGWMSLVVRTTGDPARLAGPVRAVVQGLDSDLPLFEAMALPDALERQHWFLRVFGTLFFVFAATGLLMASVGIYAVVAQATASRTREIGLRMALGATAGSVARLVLSRGLRQLGIGVALGLAGGFGFVRVMSSSGLLLRASPNDPVVFSSITALLLAVGLLACWLPARRAARIAPNEALRVE